VDKNFDPRISQKDCFKKKLIFEISYFERNLTFKILMRIPGRLRRGIRITKSVPGGFWRKKANTEPPPAAGH
jgi:hypothetical protein